MPEAAASLVASAMETPLAFRLRSSLAGVVAVLTVPLTSNGVLPNFTVVLRMVSRS